MAKGRETLAFDADVNEAAAASGFLTQLSRSFPTNAHLGPVVEAAHSTMTDDFVMDMGKLAISNVESYHHVYEWGHVGEPPARLWRDVLRGRGARRTATFEWMASKTTVPIPNIPPGPKGEQLQKIHVFVWKAPVMEYDITVNIRPRGANALAFPTGDPDKPLWFSRQGITFRPGRFQMSNGESRLRSDSGDSGHTAGMFTSAFAAWWSGPGADLAFERGIGQKIEKDWHAVPVEKATRKFRRAPTKAFKLNVAGDSRKAYAHGVKQAEGWLRDRDRDYYAMARARRK